MNGRRLPLHRGIESERGVALVLALIALVLLAAVALSLVLVTDSEMRVAANDAAAREALYAADGGLDIAAQELLEIGDWNALLAGGVVSRFADGPPAGTRQLSDGSSISLDDATRAAMVEPRPWGPNNPQWRLFAFGRLSPTAYVLAWVGDDPAENDGDATLDGAGEANPGAGVLLLRAEAVGPGGARKVVEETVRRAVGSSGVPRIEVLGWAEIR